VRLKRDGYLESQFVVGSDTPELVSRALLRDDIDWTQELNDARGGLYESLSYFVLSVPVTGVLWGGFLNVQGLLLGGASGGINESRQLELQQFGNTLYWSSLGSVLINAGLLVNVVINVIEYVRVGEGAHNQ
jgi:hypothetical protein